MTKEGTEKSYVKLSSWYLLDHVANCCGDGTAVREHQTAVHDPVTDRHQCWDRMLWDEIPMLNIGRACVMQR